MPKQSSPIKARLLIAKLLAWQPVFPLMLIS
jgi:hypothetical protein